MKIKKPIEFICTILFTAFAIFLVLILFIQPEFMEPITGFVHGFGVISVGGFSFSIGSTIAIMLFFGLIVPAIYSLRK